MARKMFWEDEDFREGGGYINLKQTDGFTGRLESLDVQKGNYGKQVVARFSEVSCKHPETGEDVEDGMGTLYIKHSRQPGGQLDLFRKSLKQFVDRPQDAEDKVLIVEIEHDHEFGENERTGEIMTGVVYTVMGVSADEDAVDSGGGEEELPF